MRLLVAALVLTSLVARGVFAQPAPTYGDIASILQQHCVICHSGQGAPNGLRLDSYENLLRGGNSGAVVISGNAAGSELVRRIRGQSQPRMPMTGPPYLDQQSEAAIAAWIEAGMPEGEGRSQNQASPTTPPIALPSGELTFTAVEPIFLKYCAKCHKDNGLRGRPPEGLRLTSWREIVAGGERAVIIPGNPGASEVVRKIRGESRPRMPLDGPPFLSQEEVRIVSDWIADGARDREGHRATVPVGQRVRLRGQLTERWVLGDVPLSVGSWTRIKKSPGPGDYVEVRGTVMGDGRIRATRIRRR